METFAPPPPVGKAPRNLMRAAPHSALSFAVNSAVLIIVALGLGYVVFWLDQPLAGALGAIAAGCLFLPLFAWREHLEDVARVCEANSKIEAHSLATDLFLQRRLDKAQEWLQIQREEDQKRILLAEAERDKAQAKLKPFVRVQGPGGRFIKQAQISGSVSRAATPRIIDSEQSPEQPLTIEGQAEQ